VYPPLRLMETVLSKHSPFVALGKLCAGGFVNQFNGDAELLDDLVPIFFSHLSPAFRANCFLKNDHWTSTYHKVLIFI
jgi:hypothetical protein